MGLAHTPFGVMRADAGDHTSLWYDDKQKTALKKLVREAGGFFNTFCPKSLWDVSIFDRFCYDAVKYFFANNKEVTDEIQSYFNQLGYALRVLNR